MTIRKPGRQTIHLLLLTVIIVFVFSACQSRNQSQPQLNQKPSGSLSQADLIQTQGATPQSTSTMTPASSDLPMMDPTECKRPSDDYTIITINGHKLNQRTYEMLTYADTLYGGAIEITDSAITQGSYTNAVAESFHTHAGGGAVDLSVMAPATYDILLDDVAPLIQALRQAGFAAWYRDFNDVYDGSPAHIHAIAIGDRELSLAAREQLAGPNGYFWGYDGLPGDSPQRDPHGGPVVCAWMKEMGYPNRTATPSQ